MKFIKEKTNWFTYALESEYDPGVVVFCKMLKDTLGWKEFSWDNTHKKWRFNDLDIIRKFAQKYSDIEISKEVSNDLIEDSSINKDISEIKNKEKSSITINGLKKELYEYQKIGVEFLLKGGGRALLADAPGCVSGDALITVNRGGDARKYSLRDLYKKMDPNQSKWDLSIQSKTRSLTNDGFFALQPIKKIIYKGVMETLKIKAVTDDGDKYEIDVTSDHRISTPNGWVEAINLKKNSMITVNGAIIEYCNVCKEKTEHAYSEYIRKYRPKNYGKCKQCIYRRIRKKNFRKTKNSKLIDGEFLDKNGYIYVSGLFYHPRYISSCKPAPSIFKHRLVYEAFINDTSYDEWIKMSKDNTFKNDSVFIPPEMIVHHKDGDKKNNDITNLELLTSKEHGLRHIHSNMRKLWNIIPKNAKITSITKNGKIDVYDIQMGGEFHNFIANGVVVHNCGKSAQALSYVSHSNFKRTLVVCPASVKFSWEDETEKWTYLSSYIVDSSTDFRDIPHDANIIIINFDILKKFYTEFMKYHWDCLIVDEAHLVKNPKAIRSKVIKSISRNIENVVLLTGTPVLSRPVEMFNMLNIIDPKTWNNYYNYAVKYCDGHQGYWGFEAKGATNLDELRNKISKYFLRRTKDDVLKELPKKNYQNIRIDLPDEYRKRYDMIEEDLITYLKRYKKDKTDKQIEKSLQAEKLVKLNLLREINAMGKLEAVKEKIDSLIESDEKVIVLSSFNGPLLELSDMYEENSVLLLGSTPVEERGEIVKQFQTNPNKKIFLGGIKSAGVGITLTAASNVIFLDLPWNPADIEQGENRAHRPGALYDSLNIYKFLSNNTIDSFMVSLLNHKQKIIDKLIEDDGEVCQDKMVNDYIKTLEEKYKKVYEKEKRNNV